MFFRKKLKLKIQQLEAVLVTTQKQLSENSEQLSDRYNTIVKLTDENKTLEAKVTLLTRENEILEGQLKAVRDTVIKLEYRNSKGSSEEFVDYLVEKEQTQRLVVRDKKTGKFKKAK